MSTKHLKKVRQNKVAKREEAVKTLGKGPLWGEIVTWTPGSGDGRTYDQIVKALDSAGLDPKEAKPLTPTGAFTRACKDLEEERTIDVIRRDDNEIVFQFTRKKLDQNGGESEWTWKKECYVHLNRTTGDITCRISVLQERAQMEFARCLEARNGSDVTGIVVRLFESQLGKLIHVDSGVYFVPSEYRDFTEKIGMFLTKIGGLVKRFPVPKGEPVADKSVTESVKEHFAQLIEDLKTKVKGFGVTTRPGTIEDHANEIKEARVRVNAYAHYLADQREDLLESVGEAMEGLKVRVKELAKMRAELPLEEQPVEDRVMAVLGKEPKDMRTIMDDCQLTSPCYPVMTKLVGEGVIAKEGKGFVKLKNREATLAVA